MSDSSRTIHWHESHYDLAKIQANKWQYQIAKVVATGNSPPTSNVVWKSLGLQPKADISWPVEYGLNWTATLPTDGVSVSVGGEWQGCNKGESFDLDNLGFWQKSTSAGKQGWLSVGNVKYSYPGVAGIHIVVGVKNNSNFDPIFVDPTELPPNSAATYQPQEQVMWWLQETNLAGSVYSSTRGAIGGVDFSSPAPSTNKYEYWTTYIFDNGVWANSATAPAQIYTAPRSASHIFGKNYKTVTVVTWPTTIVATFATAVAYAYQHTAALNITSEMDANGWTVKLAWVGTDGTKLSGEFTKKNPKAGSLEALGALVGDMSAQDAFNAALTACKDLPVGETWSFGSS